MPPRSLTLALCAYISMLALSVASAQVANHYRPRDPPLGALSRFNQETKEYEPVTSDYQYTYYRIRVNLNETSYVFFQPDPVKPTLYRNGVYGVVLDNSTATKVGTFDLTGITTALDNDATQKLHYLGTMAVELGPEGDDTFFVTASLDRAHINQEISEFEMAVTGGTGRYKGATGQVFFSGTAVTTPGNLYTAEVIVPKFKRF